MRVTVLAGTMACAAFGGYASSVSAAMSLPAATSAAECNSNNPYADDTGTISCSLQGAMASVFISGGALHAIVNDPPATATQNALASLTYSFEVVGGAPGDEVPVVIETKLYSSATYPNAADADLQVTGLSDFMVCSTCARQSFEGALKATYASGQVESIHIDIAAQEGYSTGGEAEASADPYIYVDPTFAGAANYSIEVSSDVDNVPLGGLPEPTSWALFVGGVGGIGATLRGSRRLISAMGAARHWLGRPQSAIET